MLRSVVAQGIELNEIVVPVGHGIAGTVAACGDMIDIVDAYADSRFDSSFDAVLGYRTNDLFCMPIVNRSGAVVGVLELMNRTARYWKESGVSCGVSCTCGLALENASMHWKSSRSQDERNAAGARDSTDFYPTFPRAAAGSDLRVFVMCDAVGGDYLDYFSCPKAGSSSLSETSPAKGLARRW